MWNPLRLSIRLKLVAAVSLPTLASAITLVLVLPSVMESQSRRWLERRGLGAAAMLSNAVGAALTFDDQEAALEQLATFAAVPDAAYASVFRADGSALASWGSEALPARDFPGGQSQSILRDRMVHIRIPVRGKSGVQGVLAIGMTVEQLEQERRASANAVGTIFAFGVALFVVVSVAGSTTLVSPILRITKVASGIAEGDDAARRNLDLSRGDEIGRLAVAFDRMVERLEDKSALLASQSEASSEGILVVSSNGLILLFNRRFAELWGLDPAWLANQSMFPLFEEHLVPQLEGADEYRRLVTQITEELEATSRVEVRLKDGRTFDVFSVPIGGAGGVRTARGWYVRDVTESKRAEEAVLRLNAELELRVQRRTEQLARANAELSTKLEELKRTQDQLVQAGKMAAVGTLVAGLSHELNNPIGIILGFSQSLLKGSSIPDADREPLLAIERQARRCTNLVRALLDFSRGRPAAKESCQAAGIVTRVAELTTPQAAHRGLDLKCEVPADLPAVNVSPTEMESALMNLVTNAIDATPTGGTVALSAAPVVDAGTDGVGIWVRDSGCGIPPEVLPYVFDPFFTTKPVGCGTGLGLSLAKQLVENNGGRLEIVETLQGAGTVVRIWVPSAA